MIAIPPSFWLDTNELKFPELNQALKEPNGLIGIGGDLSSERLIHAYSSGIFPWYGKEKQILWYSPDPRMEITPEAFNLSKIAFQQKRKKIKSALQEYFSVDELEKLGINPDDRPQKLTPEQYLLLAKSLK